MSTKKTPSEPQEDKTDLTADAADVQTEKADTKAEKKTKDKSSEEVKKLREELAAEKDKYLRLLAEYDNFRKRSQKERECVYADVRADTLLKFLPIYDNLARALKQETADEAYKRGVEMIFTQFIETMEKLGVAEIEACTGTKFDPGVHDAVMHVEDETFDEGVVAEEFQKGFRLGDKVIRCSVVKVAN
jgi:molecular chaperone GrpE